MQQLISVGLHKGRLNMFCFVFKIRHLQSTAFTLKLCTFNIMRTLKVETQYTSEKLFYVQWPAHRYTWTKVKNVKTGIKRLPLRWTKSSSTVSLMAFDFQELPMTSMRSLCFNLKVSHCWRSTLAQCAKLRSLWLRSRTRSRDFLKCLLCPSPNNHHHSRTRQKEYEGSWFIPEPSAALNCGDVLWLRGTNSAIRLFLCLSSSTFHGMRLYSIHRGIGRSSMFIWALTLLRKKGEAAIKQAKIQMPGGEAGLES